MVAVLSCWQRLATVIDYDRIAVLDAGRLVEFGAPAEMLDKGAFHCHNPHCLFTAISLSFPLPSGGHLAKLVEQTGPVMAAHLRTAAAAAQPTCG